MRTKTPDAANRAYGQGERILLEPGDETAVHQEVEPIEGINVEGCQIRLHNDITH